MNNQQPTQPLWRVMHDTFTKDVGEFSLGDGYGTASGDPDHSTWAAELRVVADAIDREWIDDSFAEIGSVVLISDWLRDQADNAEAGE